MLHTFLHNMTLIITFIYIYVKIKDYIFSKNMNSKTALLLPAILAGFLSLIVMTEPFRYGEMMFDLRSIPVFLISYFLGWKYGFLSIIIPSIYRIYFGGPTVIEGVLAELYLPYIIASIFGRYYNPYKESRIIKGKDVILAFIAFTIIRVISTYFTLDISFDLWLSLNISWIIFSNICLIFIILMINDSNRKLIFKEKIKKSEKQYRKLVELFPDAVLVYDRMKRVMFANEAGLKLMGYEDISDIRRKDILDIFTVHPDYKEIASSALEKLWKKEAKTEFVEQKLILKNGEMVDVEVGGVSFKHEDDIYILNIFRDITDRKRAEELNKKIKLEKKKLNEAIEVDRLKTEFFSNLSHELKTPINLIFSTVQLMEFEVKGKSLEDELNIGKRIRVLRQNCKRILRLVNNLIDITKMDSGYFKLDLSNVNIVSIVEDITLSVVDFVRDKNINIVFDTEVEEKIMAVDPDAIERIILNLLSNAIKFTNSGDKILVNIYDKDKTLLISVKDTGIGMPEDKLKIIFDRFSQVDKSLTRNHEGSGIGLSLVDSLVKMHGGSITVNSKLGVGSEFIIELPVKKDEDDLNKEIDYSRKTKVEKISIEFSDIYS